MLKTLKNAWNKVNLNINIYKFLKSLYNIYVRIYVKGEKEYG